MAINSDKKIRGNVSSPHEILNFQVARHFTNLWKSYLIMLEDIQTEHRIEFNKLKKTLPQEYHHLLDQADFLSDEKLDYLRKKILDSGNEQKRSVLTYLSHFNVDLDK